VRASTRLCQASLLAHPPVTWLETFSAKELTRQLQNTQFLRCVSFGVAPEFPVCREYTRAGRAVSRLAQWSTSRENSCSHQLTNSPASQLTGFPTHLDRRHRLVHEHPNFEYLRRSILELLLFSHNVTSAIRTSTASRVRGASRIPGQRQQLQYDRRLGRGARLNSCIHAKASGNGSRGNEHIEDADECMSIRVEDVDHRTRLPLWHPVTPILRRADVCTTFSSTRSQRVCA
jgi:hypothetical protein